MTLRLFLQAMGKYLAGVLLMGLLLFVPAGTAGYWHGWLLLGVLFVPMLLLGTALLLWDPALLRKRLELFLRVVLDKAQPQVACVLSLGKPVVGIDKHVVGL